MSDTPSLETILNQAEGREKVYDWLGADDFYSRALDSVSDQDFLKKGEIHERSGYVHYRAAFQAESLREFEERMCQAVADYEKAKEFYEKSNESIKTPRKLRSEAMVAFASYWLASGASEKKTQLDDCWRLTNDALGAFEEAGFALEYGKTYCQLVSSAFLAYVLEWNFQAGERMIREAMERGEQGVTLLLSGVDNQYELARAYAKTGFYLTAFGFYFVPDIDERERYRQKGQSYWKKAIELSEEAAMLELASTSGGSGDETGFSIDEMLVHFEKALGYAKRTKDKYLIGTALDWLAYATGWKSGANEDWDRRLETVKEAMKYAEDARNQFSLISFVSPRGDVLWTGAPYVQYYFALAAIEVDPGKRQELLEKAAVEGAHAIDMAENVGYPGIIWYAHTILGSVLSSLAQVETDLEEKKKLLEGSRDHIKRAIAINDQRYPFYYWNQGLAWNNSAGFKAELANVEKDFGSKKKMLEEAVLDKERAIQLCTKDRLYVESFAVLGRFQDSCGGLLHSLFGLTKNNEYERKAVKAFEEAVESFQKLNSVSRVAECYWKAANAYDALGEHQKAAENFAQASDNYKSAAQNISQLKSFYQDHAVYMQAWTEIEKARHHHDRQEYGLAKEHFEKAAALHKSLKQWSYLEPNYSAWAKVENAEELSRKEQSERAISVFEDAAKLFNETRDSIQAKLSKIVDTDEKQMASNMIKASDIRRKYCEARIAIEEAKILDKKGNHYSSSEKYGSAAETFERMEQASVSEQDRKEFSFITCLSRAWQKMTLAEAESSPKVYLDASQLFEQAKDFSPNEKTKMLVLGHSRFCKALEAGTKFADTLDAALHLIAIQQLESAAKFYMRAEFQNASEYARATKLLFDAYLYMDNAENERDPEKKTKLFVMAEKVLQTSAGSYTKAEHPEKMEQVLKLLEKVKEERELAMSLTEVLHAPPIISTTKTFTIPAPTHEEAVGSERFEHADIQANMIVRQKELKIGEALNLEMELVNAGKGRAQLIKISEVIPEGFELVDKPEIYRVEDSYLNMKGKRLDPLKTEELKLVLKSKFQGIFALKPTILYLDENGKYKSHEVEPVTITVKELGIKGWLRGEE